MFFIVIGPWWFIKTFRTLCVGKNYKLHFRWRVSFLTVRFVSKVEQQIDFCETPKVSIHMQIQSRRRSGSRIWLYNSYGRWAPVIFVKNTSLGKIRRAFFARRFCHERCENRRTEKSISNLKLRLHSTHPRKFHGKMTISPPTHTLRTWFLVQ